MMQTLPLLSITCVLITFQLPSCGAFFFGRRQCRSDSAAEKCGFLRLAVVQHVGTPGMSSCEETCVYFESSQSECGGCGNIDPQSPSSVNVPSPLPPVPTQSPVAIAAPSGIPPRPVATPVTAPVPIEVLLPVTGPIPVPVIVSTPFPVPMSLPTFVQPVLLPVPTTSLTKIPSTSPILPITMTPAAAPNKTNEPSKAPMKAATIQPTNVPTPNNANEPTTTPMQNPTIQPTTKPTKTPTKLPSQTPTMAPTKAPTLNYNIELDLVGVNASDLIFFADSELRWESIIRGDLASASTLFFDPPEAGCVYPEVVDDLYICARYVAIDGPNKIVGSAGPRYTRSSTNLLTITGDMEFDSADINNLKSRGNFGSVILHEIGHILGIGTRWERKNVTGPRESNCPYYGPRANAEYKNITGCDVVPTENSGTNGDGTFCSHWDEECLKSEIMTGFIKGGLNPLSKITIATLDDLGYTVDYSTAESYSRNDVNSTCTCNGQRLLSDATKINTAHQLGTSHKSTRRRSLSEDGYQRAVNYGQAILLQRQIERKSSLRADFAGTPDEFLYVGDKVLVVFVEEEGALFDVTVTL